MSFNENEIKTDIQGDNENKNDIPQSGKNEINNNNNNNNNNNDQIIIEENKGGADADASLSLVDENKNVDEIKDNVVEIGPVYSNPGDLTLDDVDNIWSSLRKAYQDVDDRVTDLIDRYGDKANLDLKFQENQRDKNHIYHVVQLSDDPGDSFGKNDIKQAENSIQGAKDDGDCLIIVSKDGKVLSICEYHNDQFISTNFNSDKPVDKLKSGGDTSPQDGEIKTEHLCLDDLQLWSLLSNEESKVEKQKLNDKHKLLLAVGPDHETRKIVNRYCDLPYQNQIEDFAKSKKALVNDFKEFKDKYKQNGFSDPVKKDYIQLIKNTATYNFAVFSEMGDFSSNDNSTEVKTDFVGIVKEKKRVIEAINNTYANSQKLATVANMAIDDLQSEITDLNKKEETLKSKIKTLSLGDYNQQSRNFYKIYEAELKQLQLYKQFFLLNLLEKLKPSQQKLNKNPHKYYDAIRKYGKDYVRQQGGLNDHCVGQLNLCKIIPPEGADWWDKDNKKIETESNKIKKLEIYCRNHLSLTFESGPVVLMPNGGGARLCYYNNKNEFKILNENETKELLTHLHLEDKSLHHPQGGDGGDMPKLYGEQHYLFKQHLKQKVHRDIVRPIQVYGKVTTADDSNNVLPHNKVREFNFKGLSITPITQDVQASENYIKKLDDISAKKKIEAKKIVMRRQKDAEYFSKMEEGGNFAVHGFFKAILIGVGAMDSFDTYAAVKQDNNGNIIYQIHEGSPSYKSSRKNNAEAFNEALSYLDSRDSLRGRKIQGKNLSYKGMEYLFQKSMKKEIGDYYFDFSKPNLDFGGRFERNKATPYMRKYNNIGKKVLAPAVNGMKDAMKESNFNRTNYLADSYLKNIYRINEHEVSLFFKYLPASIRRKMVGFLLQDPSRYGEASVNTMIKLINKHDSLSQNFIQNVLGDDFDVICGDDIDNNTIKLIKPIFSSQLDNYRLLDQLTQHLIDKIIDGDNRKKASQNIAKIAGLEMGQAFKNYTNPDKRYDMVSEALDKLDRMALKLYPDSEEDRNNAMKFMLDQFMKGFISELGPINTNKQKKHFLKTIQAVFLQLAAIANAKKGDSLVVRDWGLYFYRTQGNQRVNKDEGPTGYNLWDYICERLYKHSVINNPTNDQVLDDKNQIKRKVEQDILGHCDNIPDNLRNKNNFERNTSNLFSKKISHTFSRGRRKGWFVKLEPGRKGVYSDDEIKSVGKELNRAGMPTW